jgi:peptidoglycan hydrolase CwlO-like protein
MFKKIFVSLLLSICLFFSFNPTLVLSEDTSELQTKINEYSQKLKELGTSKNTLANQIKLLDSQYQLTLLKITQTENSITALEKEIADLSVEIGKLEKEINQLSVNYINQIIQSYKLQKKYPSFAYLLSDNLNTFLEQHQYLSSIQTNSKQNLIDMETVRYSYDQQKIAKEKKQTELVELQKTLATQKSSLITQKESKSTLLEITKNDEKKYQLLKQAAEQELSALLSAKFVEKKEVKKGEILGLMGNTGYSFGAHLHFGLYSLKESEISSWLYVNDIDSMGYINQYGWPMDDPTITQGRGATKYAYLYSDRFHHGIDMVSTNKIIKAVNDGVAYFYRNEGSSLGNHVKLFHSDGKMTLYLHMQ